MGQLYLSNVDFLKNGVPASIIATMVSSKTYARSCCGSLTRVQRSSPPLVTCSCGLLGMSSPSSSTIPCSCWSLTSSTGFDRDTRVLDGFLDLPGAHMASMLQTFLFGSHQAIYATLHSG